MSENKCFCHLNGYEVKDAKARQGVETLNNTANSISEDITVLENRMNTFTALPEGSTTADSELLDIRVGDDGVIYASAGESVRTQVSNLKETLVNYTYINSKSVIWNQYILDSAGKLNDSSNLAGYSHNTPIPVKVGETIKLSDESSIYRANIYNDVEMTSFIKQEVVEKTEYIATTSGFVSFNILKPYTEIEGVTIDTVKSLIEDVHEKYVTPEMFGAIGDGVVDDTEALKECFASDKIVVLDNEYLITKPFTIDNHIRIYGSGKILIGCASGIKFNGNVYLKGVEIKAYTTSINHLITFAGEKVVIENVTISSRYTLSSDMFTSMFSFESCTHVIINGIYLSNLNKIGDGVQANDIGCITGMYFGDCDKVSINNLIANEIHSRLNSTTIRLDDSNCLYIQGKSTFATITNSKFTNCGKRTIKTQCKYVNISNCYFYNDCSDNSVMVGIQDYESEELNGAGKIDDCYFENKHENGYCIASSENITVINTHINSIGSALLVNGNHKYLLCTIKGVIEEDEYTPELYYCDVVN